MDDFGKISDFEVNLKHGNHKVVRYPNTIYEFHWKSGPFGQDNTINYVCKQCKLVKNKNPTIGKVPTMSVRNGIIITDPVNPENAHFCLPLSASKVQTQKAGREERYHRRRSEKRSRQDNANTKCLRKDMKASTPQNLELLKLPLDKGILLCFLF